MSDLYRYRIFDGKRYDALSRHIDDLEDSFMPLDEVGMLDFVYDTTRLLKEIIADVDCARGMRRLSDGDLENLAVDIDKEIRRRSSQKKP